MTWTLLIGLIILSLAAVGAFVCFMGPLLLLRTHGATEARPDQAPLAHAMLAELAPEARIEAPELFVIPTPQPNGFVVASRTRRIVAVTEGVFERLDAGQLRGLLALLVTNLARRRARIETAIAALALVAAPFVLPSMALVRLGIRGDRWHDVDAAAATLIGVEPVADALLKLESERKTSASFAASTTAGMFCVMPTRATAASWTGRAYATQPPTDERVARLRRLSVPARPSVVVRGDRDAFNRSS